jgi:putative tricarboxylic transport membrane protein
MSDRLFGGIALLLALAFIAGATQIQAALIFDSLGPRAFPIIIGVVLAISSCFLILRPDPEPDWPAARRVVEILLALVVMLAYAYLLEPLGFVVATAVAAGLLSWRLGATPTIGGLTGVGISVGIYVVFHMILGLSLARGPLGF